MKTSMAQGGGYTLKEPAEASSMKLFWMAVSVMTSILTLTMAAVLDEIIKTAFSFFSRTSMRRGSYWYHEVKRNQGHILTMIIDSRRFGWIG